MAVFAAGIIVAAARPAGFSYSSVGWDSLATSSTCWAEPNRQRICFAVNAQVLPTYVFHGVGKPLPTYALLLYVVVVHDFCMLFLCIFLFYMTQCPTLEGRQI